MTPQPDKTYPQSAAALEQDIAPETGYDVLATVVGMALIIVFAAVVGTQGSDYVAAKIERLADVTSWTRR